MNKNNNLIKGIVFALVTAVISGISIFYSKISLTKIDPLILTTSRNLFVGVMFIVSIIIFGKLKQLKNLKRKQILPLILIGIIGGGIPFYLFFSGLQLIGAQNANMIHKSLFLWVALLAAMFLKERFNIGFLISYVLIFVGNYLFMPVQLHFGSGEILVFSAALMWSIENVIAKKILKEVSSELVGMFRMGIGSLILIGLTVFTGKSGLFFRLNAQQLSVIIIGGMILGFYVYFWYKSLRLASASLVTLLLTFSIVVGNILNGAFAGVQLGQKDIISSLFIGAGTLLILITMLKNLKPDLMRNVRRS